jgi:hypothetical protein
LQIAEERAILPERFMSMSSNVIEHAEDEIVFALRKQTIRVAPRQVETEPKERARLPLPAEDRDLDSALEDMIERFPKTLEYLAK